VGSGFFIEDSKPALRGVVVPLHISSELTIPILTGPRVARRPAHPPQPFVDGLKRREHAGAHAAHGLIYGRMVLMRLTGWPITSAQQPHAGGGPIFWRLFSAPPITPPAHLDVTAQKAGHASLVELHSTAAGSARHCRCCVGTTLKH
jgi:cytochrome b561